MPTRKAAGRAPAGRTKRRTIVAYAAEDGRLGDVRRAALERSRREDARLILYDVDAAGVFQKPLPTDWSGEGSEGQFGDILGPGDLERAGRHAMAVQVSEARAEGIDAWAWLPGDLGARALSQYLGRVDADVLIVSPEVGHPGGPLEDLERARPAEIDEASTPLGVEVMVVGEDGRLEKT